MLRLLLTVAALLAGFALLSSCRARLELPIEHAALSLSELEEREIEAEPTPGTEARIVWAEQKGSRTTDVVVYLHGFSASRQDTAPVAARLAAERGANLVEWRLHGHGLGGDVLGETTATEWLEDAQDAVSVGTELGERLVVLGHSTGATLAVWAASEGLLPANSTIVLLSPNFGVANPLGNILHWRLVTPLFSLFAGEQGFEPKNEAHGTYWTTAYPLRAAKQLAILTEAVRALPFADQTVPMLMMLGSGDDLIDKDAASAAFDAWGSEQKELVVLSTDKCLDAHALAGDILCPQNTDRVLSLARKFLDW